MARLRVFQCCAGNNQFETSKQVKRPFSNGNAHFDLRHGIAEADYMLADALQTSDGGYIISYHLKKNRKISYLDYSGRPVWTIHLPTSDNKIHLVDESHLVNIEK